MPVFRTRLGWRSLFGAALVIEPAWKGIRWLLDWAGIIDLIISHWSEPGWVGVVLGWIIDPPGWVYLPCLVIGLALIYWDIRERNKKDRNVLSRKEAPQILRLPAKNFSKQEKTLQEIDNRELASIVSGFALTILSREVLENSKQMRETGEIKVFELKMKRKREWNEEARNSISKEILNAEDVQRERLEAHYARRLSEFRTQFLPQAIKLKEELSRRTGRPIGGIDDSTVDLIQRGKIQNDSLQILSEYLQSMSKMLK